MPCCPYGQAAVPDKNAKSLVSLATDKKHFWRPNGVTMVSAQDEHFDPTNALGGGALWLYWSSLIGEALALDRRTHKNGRYAQRIAEDAG